MSCPLKYHLVSKISCKYHLKISVKYHLALKISVKYHLKISVKYHSAVKISLKYHFKYHLKISPPQLVYFFKITLQRPLLPRLRRMAHVLSLFSFACFAHFRGVLLLYGALQLVFFYSPVADLPLFYAVWRIIGSLKHWCCWSSFTHVWCMVFLCIAVC